MDYTRTDVDLTGLIDALTSRLDYGKSLYDLLPTLAEVLRTYLPLSALVVLRRSKDDFPFSPVA